MQCRHAKISNSNPFSPLSELSAEYSSSIPPYGDIEEDMLDLPSLPQSPPLISTSIPAIVASSDPIQGPTITTSSFRAPIFSTALDRPRKRRLPPLNENEAVFTTTASSPSNNTEDLILKARDLILLALTKANNYIEQARLLDLLEIFREYTEKGRIRHASTILASQVANLEQATKRIE